MIMSKHTPTPWEVGIDDEPADGVKGIEINADDGKTNIGYVMAQEIDHYTPVDRANATFICHAVNSYVELIECLKLAHVFLDSLPRGWLGKTSGDIGALNDFYIK